MRFFFRLVCLYLFFFGFNQTALSQAIMTIQENSFDFGQIYEHEGIVSHIFAFKNTGSEPLLVTNVRTTCGCTFPSWTNKPVSPGDEGYITVEYNAENRPGKFHKTIQVQSSAENENMFLTISGNVIPKPREEKLEYKLGPLSIKSKHLNIGFIFKGDTLYETMLVANHTDKPLKIEFPDIPDHIKLSCNPSELKPGEYGYLELAYFSGLCNDWDVVINRIPVSINGKSDSKNRLPITANIREDFSLFSEEDLQNAPVISILNEEINMGKLIAVPDQKKSCKFELKNTGDSELLIRAVKPSCGCTVIMPIKERLKSGEASTIEVEFDPNWRVGEFKHSLTVITNDPKNYKKYLFITGEVQ